MTLTFQKNEPLKLISGAALHLPSKFGEDRPKDLGGDGEQTNKQTNKQTNVAQIIAISRWEIAYIVDQDQNVGLNRPPTSDFRRT